MVGTGNAERRTGKRVTGREQKCPTKKSFATFGVIDFNMAHITEIEKSN